jgi:hypothetical protein
MDRLNNLRQPAATRSPLSRQTTSDATPQVDLLAAASGLLSTDRMEHPIAGGTVRRDRPVVPTVPLNSQREAPTVGRATADNFHTAQEYMATSVRLGAGLGAGRAQAQTAASIVEESVRIADPQQRRANIREALIRAGSYVVAQLVVLLFLAYKNTTLAFEAQRVANELGGQFLSDVYHGVRREPRN